MKKIKGTKILENGKRQIYVFVEKHRRDSDRKKIRIYKTEITDLNTVAEIRDRRKELRKELRYSLENKNSLLEPDALQNLSFSEFLDKWMDEVCREKLAPRTFEDYSKYIKDFIVPFLIENGDFPMKEFSAFSVHSIIRFIKQQEKAWAINKMKAILSSAATVAVAWKIIGKNEVRENLEKSPAKDSEMRILEKEDLIKILNYCHETRYGLAIELILLSGVRPGEAAALRWRDVNFQENSIRINQTLTRPKGGGFLFKEPKSQKSKRTIFLDPSFLSKLFKKKLEQRKLIHERRKKGFRYEDYDLVFATRFGTPVSINNLNNRDFKTILDKAGLDSNYSPYSLRHSAASLLFNSGANAKDVQKLLGHATASFTIDRYIHASNDSAKETSKKFSSILNLDQNRCVIESDSVN